MVAEGAIHFKFYHYHPSLTAAAIFVILFGLTSIWHLYQLLRTRTWYFVPFILGTFCEVVGYIGRIVSAKQDPYFTKDPFIIQSLLLLIAPALCSASIYMILGRIIRILGAEKYSIIRTTWLTKVFVTSDVVCFIIQVAGGIILATAKGPSEFSLGQNVILHGLVVQLVGFSVFILVAVIFHRRVVCEPTRASLAMSTLWKPFLLVLYTVSSLILGRSIFRFIEYIQGYDGYLQSSEYWLYTFDATPMLICVHTLNVWHPSTIIAPGGHDNQPAESAAGTDMEIRYQAADDINGFPKKAASEAALEVST